MKHHYTLFEWPKSIPSGVVEKSYSLFIGNKNSTVILEDSLIASYKLKTVTYDLAVTLLGLYPNELKSYVHTKTCTQMILAALFILSKTWMQPRRLKD